MKDSSVRLDETRAPSAHPAGRAVRIPVGPVSLDGDLVPPSEGGALVVFAHGSGSSRHSPRNRFVAGRLQEAGFGTLLFDLLTRGEEIEDEFDGHLRFDISLLAWRLHLVTLWAADPAHGRPPGIGYFGASTGAAAALVAAARLGGSAVGAVVCRGGRPDLAGAALGAVVSPTLLIVGGNDADVLKLNREAFGQLACRKKMSIVKGATHLFEEPGALDEAASAATAWFRLHLGPH